MLPRHRWPGFWPGKSSQATGAFLHPCNGGTSCCCRCRRRSPAALQNALSLQRLCCCWKAVLFSIIHTATVSNIKQSHGAERSGGLLLLFSGPFTNLTLPPFEPEQPPGATSPVFILNPEGFICFLCVILDGYIQNKLPNNCIVHLWSAAALAERTPDTKTPLLLYVVGEFQSLCSSPTKPFVPLFLSVVTFQLSGSVALGVRAPHLRLLALVSGSTPSPEKHLGSLRGPCHGFLYVLLRLCKNVPLKKKKQKQKQIPLGLRLLCAQPRSCKGRNFCLEAVILFCIYFFSR